MSDKSMPKVGRIGGRRRQKRITAIKARDGMICGICGKVVSDDDLTLDHKVALADGGTHAVENLQLAHALCNFRKGSRRTPEGDLLKLQREAERLRERQARYNALVDARLAKMGVTNSRSR